MMRIVIVEDEHSSREGLVRLIGKLGGDYEVVGAADNGTEGMALVEAAKPDLVITDIKMPDMTGLEMLDRLRTKGHRHKMIILTGYSEFEYAHKAIKMSVSDYLEKPITVPDLKEALAKVKRELEQQAADRLPYPESADTLLPQLLDAEGEEAVRLADRMREAAGFAAARPMRLFVFGVDAPHSARMPQLKKAAERFRPEGCIAVSAGIASRGAAAVLLQSETLSPDALAAAAEDHTAAMAREGLESVCCFEASIEPASLKKHVDELLKLAKWSMVLGSGRTIRRQDVEAAPVRERPYPAHLESACSRAVAAANGAEAAKAVRRWIEEFADAKYGPVPTVEYSLRFVTNALRLAGELHGWSLPEPLQGGWAGRLREIRTLNEWAAVLGDIGAALSDLGGSSRPPVYSLLVQKTVRLIHERYADGVTLEEIAGQLHITTVYLSGQFNKEVGRSFSAYIKELRLRKAKELLLGSGLKTFEIALRVGYPDPKYFSRVFKEATGMSPGEYQKFNAR